MTRRTTTRLTVAAIVVALCILVGASLFKQENTGAPATTTPAPGAGDVGEPSPVAATPRTISTAGQKSDPADWPDCAAAAQDAQPEFDLNAESIRIAEQRAEIAHSLSSSGDIESQFIRLDFAREDMSKSQHVAELGRLQRADPTNALIAYRLLNLCPEDDAPATCRDISVDENLVRVDGDNALAWLGLALRAMRSDETEAALQSLQLAASAPRIRTPSVDWIVTAERALRAVGTLNSLERHIMAIGLGANASFADYGLLVAHCKREALNDADWRDACLGIGRAMESDQSSLFTMQLGRGIQEVTYVVASEPELADAAKARAYAAKDAQNKLARWSSFTGPEFGSESLDRYLEIWQHSGEIAAMQFRVEEVEAAIARGELAPCVDPQRRNPPRN